MTLDYQLHRLKGRVEASAELHFYGAAGYYKVNLLGFGRSERVAKDAAEDIMLIRLTHTGPSCRVFVIGQPRPLMGE